MKIEQFLKLVAKRRVELSKGGRQVMNVEDLQYLKAFVEVAESITWLNFGIPERESDDKEGQ